MKITPVAGPLPIQPTIDKPASPEAKAKVIAMLTGQPKPGDQQAQEHPVPNPSQVQPEDVIREPSKRLADRNVEDESQAASPEDTATPPAPEKVDPALNKQFVQLARQEKALRAKAVAQDQALKAREAALQVREAALESKDQEYTQGFISREAFKADPLQGLADIGISYEDLTQQLINHQPVNPQVKSELTQLRQELKALRTANEELKTNWENQQTSSMNAAVGQIHYDVKKLVANDPQFETIKAMGKTKDVVDLIVKTYNKDKVILTVEEAADEVEKYLVEETIMPLTRIQKIQKRIQQNSASANNDKTQQTSSQQKQPQGMKTLTNNNSSTRPMTQRERAIAAAEGRLK